MRGRAGSSSGSALGVLVCFVCVVFGLSRAGAAAGDAVSPGQVGGGRIVRLDVVGQLAPTTGVAGDAIAVAVSGGRAYLGVATRVHVLDVSTPWQPILLGMTSDPLPGTVRALTVAGDRAYVAVGAGGLQVVDVAAPDRPTAIGSLALPGDARALAVTGSLVLVAAGPGGLRLVDVADGAAPREVGALEGLGTTHALAVDGTLAFVTASDGATHRVHAVDVADPAAPRVVGTSGVAGEARALGFGPDALYVGDDSGAVTIFGRAPSGELTVLGRWTEVLRPRGIVHLGLVIVVADEAGRLSLVEVNNPARPRTNAVRSTAGRPQGLAVADRHAFVANGAQGMWVSPLTSGGGTGNYRTWVEEQNVLDGMGVAVLGDHVWYGNGGSGLIGVDVSQPAMPRMVRILSESGWITAVASADRFVAVTAQTGGVAAYDTAASPSAPNRVGAVNAPEQASGLALAGGRAYVGAGAEGLAVFAVSRSAVTRLGGIKLHGWCAGVAVSDGYAFVAAGTAGVHVVDVGDPRRPRLVTTLDTPGMAMDVAVDAGLAVVADGARGLRTVDVSDPAHPRDLGFYPVRGDSWDVALADDLAFVAANKGGLRVVDVADPAHPTLAGLLATDDAVRGVAVAGTYAYVVGEGAGLAVVRLTVGGPPTVRPTGSAGAPASATASGTPGTPGTPSTPGTPGTPGETPDVTASPGTTGTLVPGGTASATGTSPQPSPPAGTASPTSSPTSAPTGGPGAARAWLPVVVADQ